MLMNEPNEGLLGENKPQNNSSILSQGKGQNKKTLKKKQNKQQRSEVTYVLKVLNFFVGISFVGFAVYCYAYGQNQSAFQNKNFIYRWAMPAYIGISGLIILFVECRIGFMVSSMRFFYNYFGRGLFNIYAGLMPLMLIDDFNNLNTFQIICITASSLMCLVGVLYISLKLFCCEKEGDKIEKLNQQE